MPNKAAERWNEAPTQPKTWPSPYSQPLHTEGGGIGNEYFSAGKAAGIAGKPVPNLNHLTPQQQASYMEGYGLAGSINLTNDIVDGIFLASGIGSGIAYAKKLGSLAIKRFGLFGARVESQILHHSEIKFSQNSVNNIDVITESMMQHGWKGAPIDVVRMSDGTLITIDNTRLLAASRTNTLVNSIVHDANKPLTAELAERFTTKQGGTPSTWGEAVMNRINKQNNLYRDIYPNGSRITGAK